MIDTTTAFVGLDPVPEPVVLPSPQFIRVSVDEGDRPVARNIIRDTADTVADTEASPAVLCVSDMAEAPTVAFRSPNLYPFQSMHSIETPSATEEPIEEEESHSHEVTLVQVVNHDGETPDVQVSHSAGPNPASTDGREDIESGSPNCPQPRVSSVLSLSTRGPDSLGSLTCLCPPSDRLAGTGLPNEVSQAVLCVSDMAEAPSSPSTLHPLLLPNVSDLPNATAKVRCDVTGSDQLMTAAEFKLLDVNVAQLTTGISKPFFLHQSSVGTESLSPETRGCNLTVDPLAADWDDRVSNGYGIARLGKWCQQSGTQDKSLEGTYHQRVVEDLIQEVITDPNGSTMSRSVTRVHRETVREGIESHLARQQYSSSTVISFEPYHRTVNSINGLVYLDVSSFRCYRDMAAITRIIPPQSDSVVEMHRLPWVLGIFGEDEDALPALLPTLLPDQVKQELARFDACCAAQDSTKAWVPSQNKYVAAFASAVITTPMFMQASYNGHQCRFMVDLGAAVSIYRDASLFPGVAYRKDVAPIGITGVTGDSMRCNGAIQVPVTLSIDSFTGGTAADYGAFTTQTGFTGQHNDRLDVREPLSMSSLCTNLTINFEGYHFPAAGPSTPIIGMDYFIRQSDSDQFSVPKYVDFMNSCLHFQQPDRTHVQQMGLARVPVFSTSGVLPLHEVLLSPCTDVRIPPGGSAEVRLKGHCNKLASGPCIIQPHAALPQLKSYGPGSRKFMSSRYVVDPYLLRPSHSSGNQLDADSHLQWLSTLLGNDKGLIVVFGENDELHDYTEIDGVERGESDKAYHVTVTNNSPAEMLLLSGQPLATAIPAVYKESDRDVEYRLRTDAGRTDPLLKRMCPVIRSSNVAVNSIIQCVTRCEPGDIYSGAKQKLLELDQQGLSTLPLTWVPINYMSKVSSDAGSVFTLPSLVSTINVQRGLLVGKLMEYIQTRLVDTVEDRVSGRYEVSLILRRLLETHPTLVVPVIADMMVRRDTWESFSKIFQPESVSDPLSAKTDEVNMETTLIIENWVTSDERVLRITPFDNGDPALTDFDTPWWGGDEWSAYTSTVQLSLSEQERQTLAGSVWNRLFEATARVREAHAKHRVCQDNSQPGLYSFCNTEWESPLGHIDSRASTLHLSARDPSLIDGCTIDSPSVRAVNWLCNLHQVQREGHIYHEAMKRGLSEVTQSTTGCDRPVDDKAFEQDVTRFQEVITHRSRDLEAEAFLSEQENPVSGDAETGPGYHYDKALTQPEKASQLKSVWDEFRQRPEFPIVNRMVQTTDTDVNGNFVSMPSMVAMDSQSELA